MLHLGQDDLVAPADIAPAPRIGDQVDRLRRVAGEDELVAVRTAGFWLVDAESR